MSRQTMRRWAGAGVLVLAVVLPVVVSQAATPEEVEKAIQRAQTYLLDHRSKDGVWEETLTPMTGPDKDFRLSYKGRQWGGLTSIATYALLASGKDPRDREMVHPINFLLHANIQSTYGLGLSSQIVLYLPPKDTRMLVKRNALLLLRGMIQPQPGLLHRPRDWPPEAGFYGYWTGFPDGTNQPLMSLDPSTFGTHQPADWYDRSNSQYGVLGMWALAQVGEEVPPLYWQLVDAAWKRSQRDDGAWAYRSDGKSEPTPSMTAAGVATLFITQDYTLDQNWGVCHGGTRNPFIERGLQWMDNHINEALGGDYYTMYGVERIGTASGRKLFGSKDWYQIGAEYLVKHQKPDGSWGDAGSRDGPIADTGFGLVFLSRGRAPVIMNKLEYATDKAQRGMTDVWDERPRDLANLAQWVGHEQESYLNWQTVNLQVPAEDLHDAPILYISGSQSLDFSQDDVDKLRRFIEQGGIIFGNADCAKPNFVTSFQKLGKALFPKYEFRQVGIDDLLWKEQFTQWRVKPKVVELSNEVRKLMVLVPEADPSRAWQTRSDRTKESMYELGANLYLYSVGRNSALKKDQTYMVRANPDVHATKTIKVARLDVGDNPNPEPGGWPRLAAVLHNQSRIDLTIDLVKPAVLSGYRIADLTGTGKFQLSAEDRKAIKQFVEKGGTLIVDAAGGNFPFADSARAELAEMFGERSLKPLPDDSPVYKQPDGMPIKIAWRSFASGHVADRKHGHLEGITFGKRTTVFFSREDLSAGLVGEPVDGIIGYEPQTATELMDAIVRYAAGQGH